MNGFGHPAQHSAKGVKKKNMKKLFVNSICVALFGLFGLMPVYSQGLPPCSGGVLVSGGPGTGQASVYDCGTWVQVISSSLPSGGCAGSHRDCSNTPPSIGG